MKPTIGRIVHYTLNTADADDINRRRNDFGAYTRTHHRPETAGEPGATGHIGHYGNGVTAHDVYPAIVVRAFGGTTVNLQVLLDGNDHYWATSRTEGADPGHWAWPVIEHKEAPATT